MIPEIQFFAHGLPKGQPRPRAFSRGGRAAVYDPGTAEGWKGQVALAAREHLPSAPLAGALSLRLEFFLPRPKGHFLKSGLRPAAPTYHTGKPDADNFAKAVMDALTELRMWGDDSQVADLRVIKRYYPTTSGCLVTIKECA